MTMMIMALIARNVGRKHALELVLTGAAISATRAAEIGLINRAVPRSELDATVDALANDLITGIRVGHQDMPEFDFDVRTADALIAYLQSLRAS